MKATAQQERLAEYVGRSGRAESIRKELYVARRIPITGGTVRKQEQVASAIADNFIMKEIEGMARLGDDLRIKVGSTENEKADVSFSRKYKPDDRFVITVEDRADKMAVAHEFVHLSRIVDRSRKGVAKTVYRTGRNLVASPEQRAGSVFYSLNNAEECATSAEVALRVKKLGRPLAIADARRILFQDSDLHIPFGYASLGVVRIGLVMLCSCTSFDAIRFHGGS